MNRREGPLGRDYKKPILRVLPDGKPPWVRENMPAEEATLRRGGSVLGHTVSTRTAIALAVLLSLGTATVGAIAAFGGPKESAKAIKDVWSMAVGDEAKEIQDPVAAQMQRDREEAERNRDPESTWSQEESTTP